MSVALVARHFHRLSSFYVVTRPHTALALPVLFGTHSSSDSFAVDLLAHESTPLPARNRPRFPFKHLVGQNVCGKGARVLSRNMTSRFERAPPGVEDAPEVEVL